MQIEPTPATGAISVEQAVGLLAAPAAPERVEQPDIEPVEAAEPESEVEPTTEEPSEPEEVTDEPIEEPEEAAEPPIPAPQSWDADAKSKFEALPRDVQEVILARESDRDKTVQRSVQEAADARKAAETAKTEAQAVTQIKAVLDQIIPVAIKTFETKWSNWTPAHQAEMARTDPAGYVARKAEFDAETAEMARLGAVNQQTQQAAYRQFVQAEQEKLPRLAPALADPKEGPARRKALGEFLVQNGVPADQIPQLDANTIGLAYDAMQWRQAQAKAATAARPRTTPAAATPQVKPAAAAPAPSRTRSRDQAIERLDKTGSIDDAVRALRASRG